MVARPVDGGGLVFRSQPQRCWIALLVPLAVGAGTAAAAAPARSAAPARLVVTYKIGFEGPLSGPYAQFGRNERNGVRLALAQADAAGNLPFTLAFVAGDDQGDPAQAPAAAAALISDPEVKGVVGPAFSGASEAAGGAYQAAHLALVTPSASKPDLAHHGWRVFHRIIPNDPTEGVFAADWLARRGIHRMIVVQDRSPYGQGLGNATTREARAKGIHVTYLAQDGATTTNYRPLAHRITSSGVPAIFYAGYDYGAARLARALHRAAYHGLRVSGNGVRLGSFPRLAGSAGNGWYAACGCMTKYVSPAQRAFASAYRAKYHAGPPLFAAQAYDAANAIIRALKAAVAAGHTGRPAVNAALGTVDFAGVSTRVKFAADGDIAPTAARVNLFQVRQGAFVEIGPLP
jgi:branched-chain amino acid transport system substrate-binding protein